MANQKTFSRREVHRSFRKFNDIVRDLFAARFQTWGNELNHLVTHCEEDPVMRVVTGPLRSNGKINAQEWYSDAMKSVGGMVGSGRYQLPFDDDDRTALLYQFLIMVNGGKADVGSFCVNMFGTSRYQEMVDVFNREVVEKFTREVSYRLDEIVQDIGDNQEVSQDAMVVFHHHDYSTTVHGDVQGSNIATGGSTISYANASFKSVDELATAIDALRPLIADAAEPQQPPLTDALDALARAVNDSSVSKERVAEAASTISANSPTMGKRLADVAERVTVGIGSAALVQGLKHFFHIT